RERRVDGVRVERELLAVRGDVEEDTLDAGEGRGESLGKAQIARDDVDAREADRGRADRIPHERAHGRAGRGELADDLASDLARRSGDQDQGTSRGKDQFRGSWHSSNEP